MKVPVPGAGQTARFVINGFEPHGRRSRNEGYGEQHMGGVTAPAVLVLRDRRGGTSNRLGINTPGPVPDRLQVDTDHRLAVPAAGPLGVRPGRPDSWHPPLAC